MDWGLRQASFPVVNMLSVEYSLAAADYYRKLIKRGVSVRKSEDVIIATYCIKNGHALLHSDRDFQHFENYFGLRFVGI